MRQYDAESEALRKLLQSREGQQAMGSMKQLDANDIRRKIGSVDTEAAAKKLEELNLGAAADRLRHTSKEDIVKALTSNPELLEKLRSLF